MWSMDSGRFPDEAFLREKLFGSVSVSVSRPDGMLLESFSPVGLIPVPQREFGSVGSNKIAVTAIGAALILPALARARHEARMASSASNIAQILKALITYQEPNDDFFPPSLADLFPAYLDNPRVLVAPWDKEPPLIKNNLRCSYRYIGKIPFRDVGPNQLVLYEHVSSDGRRRNVAYFDGHVKSHAEMEFQRQLAEQYERFKGFMEDPNFVGDKERIQAFFEDRDFPEQ